MANQRCGPLEASGEQVITEDTTILPAATGDKHNNTRRGHVCGLSTAVSV